MHDHSGTERFPTDATGLPEARASEVVELSDGDRVGLRIAPVAKRLGDATVRMLAYNGSIPGPVLKVQEGSEVIVDVENQGDMDATVHWHGLRLENRYDGTHETQPPIQAGETLAAERERLAPYLQAEPHKTLAFIAEMDMGAPVGEGPVLYACPMHPQLVSEAPAHCPDCGMKLLPAQLVADAGGHDHEGHEHGAHDHAAAGGIEWEDYMETVYILLDVTNVGRWMAHCHIAEHHESGMMCSFDVAP